MGIEYTVINKNNKTMYDLGKGGWSALSLDKEAFQDLEYLSNYIMYECYCHVFDDDIMHYTEEEKNSVKNYITTRIAPDLFEFTKDALPDDIEIFGDGGDELSICRSLGYIFTGTRFEEKLSPQWNVYLNDLNYHIHNAFYKSRYAITDYIADPFYKKLIK